MLADGASAMLEDTERQAMGDPDASGGGGGGGGGGWSLSRLPASQGGAPYSMLTPTLQGGMPRLPPPQCQAQFTWRGLGEAHSQGGAGPGQYGGMAPRMAPRLLADGNATLIDFSSGYPDAQAAAARASGTPNAHMFAGAGWPMMSDAAVRGFLRGDQGWQQLGHAGAGAAGPGWGAPASSHWWGAGVASSPRSIAGPGQMFQGQGGAGMMQFSVGQGGMQQFSSSSSGSSTASSSTGAEGNNATNAGTVQPADCWVGSADEAKAGPGKQKRKRPPSLSCIETAAGALGVAGGCEAGFGSAVSRRRIEPGESAEAAGQACNGGIVLPPLPSATIKLGSTGGGNGGGNVVLAPLTPMTPFAVGDGWALPLTPQRAAAADGWTPTGASAEALARGDSWTFSITPRTPRDLTLQVM